MVGNQLFDCLDVVFGYLCYPEFSFCYHDFILHDKQGGVQCFFNQGRLIE
jgi:hypothetical protein